MIKAFHSYPILVIVFFLLLSCTKGVDDNSDEPTPSVIDQNRVKWVNSFDDKEKELVYKNDQDSTVQLEIFIAYSPIANSTYLGNAVLAFPEGTHPENKNVYLSLMALASEDDLRIMCTRTGIVFSIARFDGVTEVVTSEKDTHFDVNYSSGYDFNGQSGPAISFTTKSIENLATGGIIPPKRMVLLREVGIVEWEDFNGNIWKLQQ